MSSQPSTMTKKDRIAEVGKGLRRSSTMKPCSKQAQLEQVAQDHVHLQFQISPGTETPQTFQVSCPSVWLHWPQWKGFFLCLNVIFSIWVQWLSPVLLGQGSALGKAPSSASAGPSLHTSKVQALLLQGLWQDLIQLLSLSDEMLHVALLQLFYLMTQMLYYCTLPAAKDTISSSPSVMSCQAGS